VVVADVWLRAGVRESLKIRLAWLTSLEHMIFRHCGASAWVFDREIENRGGMSNAATSHDYTHYFLTTAAPYLEDTLPHLAELL